MNGMDGSRAEIPQSVIAIARLKAARLAAKRLIARDEAEDVLHVLLARYLQARASYDAAQGAVEPFAEAVFQRAEANLVRDRRNNKQAPRGTVSLSVTIKLQDREYGELAGAIGQHHLSARTGHRTLDDQTAIELKLDLASLLTALPPADRDLLVRLQTGSVAEVGRDLGIPATTIHSRLTKFRQLFEDTGLRDYLR